MKALTWDAVLDDINGTYLVGYLGEPWPFAETCKRLERLSGQDIFSQAGDKTTVEAWGHYDGQVFTLYDYYEGGSLHIGGSGALDVEGLKDRLLAELALVKG